MFFDLKIKKASTVYKTRKKTLLSLSQIDKYSRVKCRIYKTMFFDCFLFLNSIKFAECSCFLADFMNTLP